MLYIFYCNVKAQTAVSTFNDYPSWMKQPYKDIEEAHPSWKPVEHCRWIRRVRMWGTGPQLSVSLCPTSLTPPKALWWNHSLTSLVMLSSSFFLEPSSWKPPCFLSVLPLMWWECWCSILVGSNQPGLFWTKEWMSAGRLFALDTCHFYQSSVSGKTGEQLVLK